MRQRCVGVCGAIAAPAAAGAAAKVLLQDQQLLRVCDSWQASDGELKAANCCAALVLRGFSGYMGCGTAVVLVVNMIGPGSARAWKRIFLVRFLAVLR